MYLNVRSVFKMKFVINLLHKIFIGSFITSPLAVVGYSLLYISRLTHLLHKVKKFDFL